MRMTMMGRWAALLLLAGLLAGPAVPTSAAAGFAVVVAQDDDEDDDREDDDSDDDREDEREEREDEREERREEREEEREEREERKNPVESAAGYDVDVTCIVADDAASTECTVAGVAPAGGKRISSIVMPEDALCSEVIGGEHRYVDPDRQTDVTGYESQGKDRTLILVLEGQVTTGGAATYWIKAANEIFPAVGPGFFCDEPAAGTTQDAPPATLEATFTATPADASATGTVTVSTYACTGVPDDTSGYDWYGACDAGGDHRFVLAPIEDGTPELLAADTAKSGEATFAGVPLGRYDLDSVDATWCHAESDAVNDEGHVVVEAGAETTVWLFYCQDGAGS